MFVRDAKEVKEEDDDPYLAIRYFYPDDYDKDKQTALCGNIVGMCNAVRQLSGYFPHTVTLQTFEFKVIEPESQIVVAVGRPKSGLPEQEKKLQTLVELIILRYSSFSNMLQQWKKTESKDDLSGILKRIQTITKLPLSYNIQMKATILLEHFSKQSFSYGICLFYDDKLLFSQIDDELTSKLYLSKVFADENDDSAIIGSGAKTSKLFHYSVYIAKKTLEQLTFFNNIKVRKFYSRQRSKQPVKTSITSRRPDSSSNSEEELDVMGDALSSDQDLIQVELVIISTNHTLLFVLCDTVDSNFYLKWESNLIQLDEQLQLKMHNSDVEERNE